MEFNIDGISSSEIVEKIKRPNSIRYQLHSDENFIFIFEKSKYIPPKPPSSQSADQTLVGRKPEK